MTQARALWFQTYGQASIRTETLPALQAGWCEIRTLFSALSPGTERLVITAQVPADLHEDMRCPYMEGSFSFPVKYGYSLVGEVVAGPESVCGQRVHVLHPHQDRCIVRIEDAYPLPADLPAQRATLASNLETAVNALWDAQVRLGERVLVVGFGIVGSLVARLLCGIPGVQVEIIDKALNKVRLATELGFCASLPEQVSASYDLAFHVSGHAEGLQTAIDNVGCEGRVVELSWYGTRPATLRLGGTFHSQRKSIISSQVSNIPPSQGPRWNHRRRKALVFNLLQNPAFDAHLTHTAPFAELPQVFAQLTQRPAEGLATLVDYRQRR